MLPTSWQAVEYAGVPAGGSVVVLGLGPIGDMSARIARHRGAGRVIGVDLVPERLARARRHGVETLDLREHQKDLAEVIRGMTAGRGPDAVIDAVGMEAHGSPGAKIAQQVTGLLPQASRRNYSCLVDPVLDGEIRNAPEVPHIAGHEDQPSRQRDRGDPQVGLR